MLFTKNRPFCGIPILGQKLRLTPCFLPKIGPFSKYQFWDQKVRIYPLIFTKNRPFLEIPILGSKGKAIPFAFYRKKALFRNTDFLSIDNAIPFAVY